MIHLLTQITLLLRGPSAETHSIRTGITTRVILTILCGMIYGAALGSFAERPLQIVFSAIKVPMLLAVTFTIALPSFFVFNTIFGLRSDFRDVLRALIGGQAGLTVVLASLAPYTLLWYASSGSYLGAQLFNGGMFAIATLAAQRMIRKLYRPLIARDSRHRWLLMLWLVIYTFIAVQMAWVLRPFIGSPGNPVQFFRADSWGNAYLILGREFWNAMRA